MRSTRWPISSTGPFVLTHLIGRCHDLQGDGAAAQAAFEVIATIQAATFSHQPRGGPVALNMLGQLAIKAGNLEAASRDLPYALPLFEEHGMADDALQARGTLALVKGLEAERRGDREAAEQAFDEALGLLEQALRELTAEEGWSFGRSVPPSRHCEDAARQGPARPHQRANACDKELPWHKKTRQAHCSTDQDQTHCGPEIDGLACHEQPSPGYSRDQSSRKHLHPKGAPEALWRS